MIAVLLAALFVLNAGGDIMPALSFASDNASTLSPASRIRPIVSIEEKEGRFLIVEDETEKDRLTEGFKEDAGFIYLSLLIGQVAAAYEGRISAEGLKSLIKEQLSHIDFTRFRWEELYKGGGAYYLPYSDKLHERNFILRYTLLDKKSAPPAGGFTVFEKEDGAKVVCEVVEKAASVRSSAGKKLPDGSPWYVAIMLKETFDRAAVTAEDLRLKTEGRMSDRHLAVETIERDLGTLVYLGLVQKYGSGKGAFYSLKKMSGEEWEIAERVLIRLGPRPSAEEKESAKKDLETKLALQMAEISSAAVSPGDVKTEDPYAGAAKEVYEGIRGIYMGLDSMPFKINERNPVLDPVVFAWTFRKHYPAPSDEAGAVMLRVLKGFRQEDFFSVFWNVYSNNLSWWDVRDTGKLGEKFKNVKILSATPRRKIPEISLELIDYDIEGIPENEIADLKAAARVVNGWIRDGVEIDRSPDDFIYHVRRLHAIATESMLIKPEDAEISPYRLVGVHSAIRPRLYPDAKDVEVFMAALSFKVLSPDFKAMHPLMQAATVYMELGDIQPFMDGNKRVAKLIMDYYLMRNHLPPLEVSAENREEFVRTVRFMKKPEEFADFLADQIIRQGRMYEQHGEVMSRLVSPEETKEKHLMIFSETSDLYGGLADKLREALKEAQPVVMMIPDETMMGFWASEVVKRACLKPDDPGYLGISGCTLILGMETLTTHEIYDNFMQEVMNRLPPSNRFKRIIRYDDSEMTGSEAVQNFKKEVASVPGVSLVMAGLGSEGQLGCNERTVPYDSSARIVRLVSPLRSYGDPKHQYAFTVGLGDVLKAKKIVVAALTDTEDAGADKDYYLSKAHAVKEAISTLNVPASAVRAHENAGFFFFVDDKSAGRGLGRGFYDNLKGVFRRTEIADVNHEEVRTLKVGKISGAFKVWIKSDFPPEEIDVQLWSDIVEGDQTRRGWHAVKMSYVQREKDGACRFETRIIPLKEGAYEYTVRVAPKKRPIQTRWADEWVWRHGANKQCKVLAANGNGKDHSTSTPPLVKGASGERSVQGPEAAADASPTFSAMWEEHRRKAADGGTDRSASLRIYKELFDLANDPSSWPGECREGWEKELITRNSALSDGELAERFLSCQEGPSSRDKDLRSMRKLSTLAGTFTVMSMSTSFRDSAKRRKYREQFWVLTEWIYRHWDDKPKAPSSSYWKDLEEKHADNYRELFAGSQVNTAKEFLDELMIKAFEAQKKNEHIIIGIDTSWIPDKNGMQELLSAIARLSELKNVFVVRGSGDDLADTVWDAANSEKTKTSLSNVVVLGHADAVRSKAFDRLRSTPGERKACIIGVNPADIAMSVDSGEENYIRIFEMLIAALKIAFAESDPIGLAMDGVRVSRVGPREWLFMPRAEPVPLGESKKIYDRQLQVLLAA